MERGGAALLGGGGEGKREGEGETLGSDGPKAHLVVRPLSPPLAAPLDGI